MCSSGVQIKTMLQNVIIKFSSWTKNWSFLLPRGWNTAEITVQKNIIVLSILLECVPFINLEAINVLTSKNKHLIIIDL